MSLSLCSVSRLSFSAFLLVTFSATYAHAEWLKGNTHCHTEVSSDSTTPIEDLMGWYKNNDYDFIVITDHNRYTGLEVLNSLEFMNENTNTMERVVDDTFLIIPGEELTTNAHHVNGLDMPYRVEPGSTITASFELVWEAGAFPQLNHPEWSFLTAPDIVEEIADLQGPMFLEVFNSHPTVVERSGPSSEDIWDGVLSAGKRVFGVAVDDAHTLENGDKPPGGGYIYVDAEERSADAILDAMQSGRFYASSGATLRDFSWTSNVYEVDAPNATSITFFGQGGAVLQQTQGDFASYVFQGNETYVRARVDSPDGFAWTQPCFLNEQPDNPTPRAAFTASLTEGVAPLRVTFDASASSDDEEIISYRWDFGDAREGRGEFLAHTFENPGVYDVELTVFDNEGALNRSVQTIRVFAPNNQENNGTSGGSTSSTTGDITDTSSTGGATSTPATPPRSSVRSQEDDCSTTSPNAPTPLTPFLVISFLGAVYFLRRRHTKNRL